MNPDRRPSCRGAVKRAAGGARAAGGGTSIHKLLERDGSVLMPGCYDALSATIIEKQGFSAAFISGYATSASLLGKPDFGLLTPPEMCATARFVCNTVRIPVIVDADTGGGNALNVRRTVKELIAAGAAGCFLEDQVWPKKCGEFPLPPSAALVERLNFCCHQSRENGSEGAPEVWEQACRVITSWGPETSWPGCWQVHLHLTVAQLLTGNAWCCGPHMLCLLPAPADAVSVAAAAQAT